MLKLFRTNHLISGAMLIFYIALVQSVIFILNPIEVPLQEGGILAELLFQYTGQTGLIAGLASMGIIFINALILNYFVAQNFLAKEINLFPGLFYILASSSVPGFLGLSSIHLANMFLIMACFSLFEIYKVNSAAKYIFNAGVLLGISSMFFLPFFVFLLWAIIAVNSLRSIKLKHIFMLLTGFILPWIYVFLVAFWKGEVEMYLDKYVLNEIGLWSFSFGENILDYLSLSVFVLLFLLALFGYNNNLMKKKFEVKKKINLIYWLMFFSLVMLLFCSPASHEQLLPLTIPVGIALSFIFTRMKAPFDGLYHFLLLIFVVGMHYLHFLNVI